MNINQLKAAKKERKITYEQLSKISGVPISTIYDIFRGVTSAPRIDTMQAIEEALGLSSPLEWTEEEQALGIGNYSTRLSKEEWEWLELRSQVIEKYGEVYLDTVKKMLLALIENNQK